MEAPVKLQSQETRRFSVKELRANAKRSRPPSERKSVFVYTIAGLVVGLALVLLYRALTR